MATANEWRDRVKTVSSLKGDERSRALALYQVDWKREYRDAFERHAKSRGWVTDVIGDMCQRTVANAYHLLNFANPALAAQNMVEEIENADER